MSQRSSLFSRTFPASLRAPVRASVIVLETVLAADEEDAQLLSARHGGIRGGFLAPHIARLPAKRWIDRVGDTRVSRGPRGLVCVTELHSDNIRRPALRSGCSRTRRCCRSASGCRAAE